ncbi:MAG: glycosyltransferase family 2 protein [Leptolyngbya sp. SIO1E4]|nr:glycosyltransferase family 2 protein [Leptolyngbya sp. SIO1E4]
MVTQATALDDILVIIPALNEAATIGRVIQTLQTVGLSRIRVVDNGSRDRTPEIAADAGADVIYEPIKGYGQACWRGLQGVDSDIEWILFCDADGSDDLSQLPELLAQRADFDFILGNRRGTAAGRGNLTPVQNFGNGLASTLIYWGWGYRYHDLGPLRLIRRRAIEQIQMRDRGFGWTVEMQARAVECELQICELPVNYRPRQGGQSKISGTLSGSVKAGTIILITLAVLYARTFDVRTFDAQTLRETPAPHHLNSKLQNSAPPPGDRIHEHPPENISENSPPPPWINRLLLGLSTVFLICGAVWSLPHGDFLNEPTAVPQFWWGMGAMGVGFVLAWGLRSVTASWFWGVAIATRIVLLAMHPGDDIWRYLWEGYIQTQGFSPYDYAPNAEILAPLRTAWWSQINHPDVSAIYPPVTQFGFRLLASLAPSVLLFKAALTAADLGICWLLSQRFGYLATLLYAWNPLVIYSFAGGGHYDSWFLLPVVAAWLWFERPYARSLTPVPPLFHWLGSAFLIGVSIAVKWISLPILSFLAWQSLRRGKGMLMVGVVLMGLMPLVVSALPFCNLQACPLIPTGSVFVNYGRSADLIPYWVADIWPPSRWENWLYAIPLGLVVVWLLLRTRQFGQFAEWYVIGLLVLSPIVHGWYFTWLVPFGVASRNLGIRLVSLSAFIYFALPHRIALDNPSWVLTQSERWSLWLPFVIGVFWTALSQTFSQRSLRQSSASFRSM